MPTGITGQSGGVIKQSTNIPLTGCAAAKPTIKHHKKTTVHMRLIVGRQAVAGATSVRL